MQEILAAAAQNSESLKKYNKKFIISLITMKLFSKLKKSNATQHISEAASSVAHGRVVSSRFFKKYFVQITFMVCMIMVYISNRYDCVTGMETIAALESELAIIKTELQSERSHYMSSTRESAMQALVDTLNLDLGIQGRPPYQIMYTDERK